MTAPVLLSLLACDAFDKAKDTIDGVLDPVVAEGIVLGVQPPQNEDLDEILERSEVQAGTTVTLFMADARDVQEIEEAPITGATVRITGPGVDAAVGEVGDGLYLLTPADGNVPYTSGDTWTLTVDRTRGDQSATSTATVRLPEDADFTGVIPSQMDPGTAIDLDFTGLGFDGALVLVIDDEGNTTYSNEPTTIMEVYEFTHGSGDLGVVTIPGAAFPDEGAYLVGVAGMINTDAADLDEMNTALSSVLSGRMRLYGVSTIALVPPG